MSKTWMLFVFLAGAAVTYGQGSWEEEQDWSVTQNLDGRFRIETPGPLRETVDTLETAIGTQVYHTLFFKSPEDGTAENLIYVMSYVDYPEGTLHHDSTDLVQELLVSSEEGAAEALRGEVIYATDRTVEGFPGRIWRINYKDGAAVARTLAFVVGGRYYELKTFALAGAGAGGAANRFFESFHYLTATPVGGAGRRP